MIFFCTQVHTSKHTYHTFKHSILHDLSATFIHFTCTYTHKQIHISHIQRLNTLYYIVNAAHILLYMTMKFLIVFIFFSGLQSSNADDARGEACCDVINF